jgi:hypothetical protein
MSQPSHDHPPPSVVTREVLPPGSQPRSAGLRFHLLASLGCVSLENLFGTTNVTLASEIAGIDAAQVTKRDYSNLAGRDSEANPHLPAREFSGILKSGALLLLATLKEVEYRDSPAPLRR